MAGHTVKFSPENRPQILFITPIGDIAQIIVFSDIVASPGGL